jgi:translation elongation factor P/translation initiation factor 5A
MDLQLLMPWMSFAALAISLGTTITTFFTSGAKINAAKLADHEHRLSTLENDMKHMPDKDSVHKLQLDLTEMKGHLGVMAKSTEATERTTRRLEEYIVNRNG